MNKTLVVVLLALIYCGESAAQYPPETSSTDHGYITQVTGTGPWIVLAYYEDKADVLALKPFYDLWKLDDKNQSVLLQVTHQADFQELLDRGFKVKLHQKLMAQQVRLKQASSQGIKAINNFPCYRTVDETFDDMNDMASNYPELVTLVDIGDSWHKTQPGGDPGHDMQVVKITNQNVNVIDKPILYAMGSIHSREYPPAELVSRFAEHLLSEYGEDADVTWLVDYHEIHLLLQGNPDGRVISEGESSAFQRKNYNANHCPGGGGFGNMQGVDMNRNFLFRWNQGTGSSGTECDSIYRGLSAISEPETMAINSYIHTLFPDQRPDDLVTPAPSDKPGVYLDIHNVDESILFPFGFSDGVEEAPNHSDLLTLARKMGFFNGYRSEQSNSTLGGADGASDDNAYGTLGVAAYTIELGENGFYSTCASFENTIWPDNLPALIYAAKASRKPYELASGPDVVNLPSNPILVATGDSFVISGIATDLRFNNNNLNINNSPEPTQNITAVNAYLDIPSWLPGASATALSAADGTFDSMSEDFTGNIDVSGLAEGRYTLFLEATDAAGDVGVPAAVFIDVVNPANLATINGTVRDLTNNNPIAMAQVTYDGVMVNTDNQGDYNIQVSATTSDLLVNKMGYISQQILGLETTAGQTTNQDFFLEPSCEVERLSTDVETMSGISEGWTNPSGTGTNDWRVEAGDDHTIGNGKSFVASDVAVVTDKSLVSPDIALSEGSELVFWHQHQFESSNDNYDGGVLEISVNGGNWTDLGSEITQNGYNGTLNGGFGQPLGARDAFVDSLGTFTEVRVDLSAYANQTVNIRWRMGTDNSTSAGDWKVDDIQIFSQEPCVDNSDLIFADGFEG